MYTMTITYNFDTHYVCECFKTKEDALKEMNRLLKEEVDTIVNECGYEPEVEEYLENYKRLNYKKGYNDEPLYAEYRVMEVKGE